MANLATIYEPREVPYPVPGENPVKSDCATARLIPGSQRELLLSGSKLRAIISAAGEKSSVVSARAGGTDPQTGVNVLLVGDPNAMRRVACAIRKESPNRTIKCMVPEWQLRNGAQIARIARQEHIDEVVVAGVSAGRLSQIIEECSRNALDVVLVPELGGLQALAVENLGGIR